MYTTETASVRRRSGVSRARTLDSLRLFGRRIISLGVGFSSINCFDRLESQFPSGSTISTFSSPASALPPFPQEPRFSLAPSRLSTPGGGTTTSEKVASGPHGVLSGDRRSSINRFESQPAGMKTASDVLTHKLGEGREMGARKVMGAVYRGGRPYEEDAIRWGLI